MYIYGSNERKKLYCLKPPRHDTLSSYPHPGRRVLTMTSADKYSVSQWTLRATQTAPDTLSRYSGFTFIVLLCFCYFTKICCFSKSKPVWRRLCQTLKNSNRSSSMSMKLKLWAQSVNVSSAKRSTCAPFVQRSCYSMMSGCCMEVVGYWRSNIISFVFFMPFCLIRIYKYKWKQNMGNNEVFF